MNFTDLFIKRPVLSTVVSIAILLLGVFSLNHLPVRQYPLISADKIVINTNFPGADADVMAGFVSQPIEAAVSTVSGINYMTSSNSKGSSEITCILDLGVDSDAVLTNITAKVSSVLWRLPKAIQTPVIQKQNVSSNPVYFLALNSNVLSREQMTDFGQRVIKPQLESIEGIQDIKLFGSREYAMRIWLDPFKMAAHQVTAQDVQRALLENNVQTAAGEIRSPNQQYSITADTDLHDVNEFNHIVVRHENHALIHIKDIGQAKLESANDAINTYADGFKNTIVVAVIPKSTASVINVARNVQQIMDTKIKRQMPHDIQTKLLFNTGVLVKQSIHEIIQTFLEAIVLVMLVIYLFIGSLRSAIIPCVAIPLSILGSGSLMYLFNYSINTLTMLAWVIAIGLVVDDSIVVLENIHRHIEAGLPPLKAALIGAAEIRFAVIAMTLTLAAVFAPIGFTGGITGALFKEFAFTMAMTVFISGIVALTLSPMMCSRILLSREHVKNRFEAGVEKYFETLRIRYEWLLQCTLKKRSFVVVFVGILLGLIAHLVHLTPSELSPPDYQGVALAIGIGPSAANPNYMERKMKAVVNTFAHLPAILHYGLVTGIPMGPQSGIAFVTLKPLSQRKESEATILGIMSKKVSRIQGITAFAVNRPSLPGSGSLQPISFVLKSTGDYPQLAQTAQKIIAATRAHSPIVAARTDLKLDSPETNIVIDKPKALSLGINMNQISAALGILFGKPQLNFFSRNQRSYPVVPQVYKTFRDSPQDIKNLFVHSLSGKLLSLDNLATITQRVIPASLNHFQQFNSATISGNLAPGQTLGQAVDFLVKTANRVMPKDTTYDFSSQMREFVDSNHATLQAFIFSLVFIFLMLAAQYESFRDPFIILISVPTSIFGAMLFIYLSGGTLNIYTKIGLITLIGLISKHGILIVTVANQLQIEEKLNRLEAAKQAAGIRLRPVLMTTAALILGVMPLILTTGSGSIARHQLGWTLIGGMSIGTLMTLFVVPTIYTLLAEKK